MTVEDLLNKKVAFKKGTLPAKKLEEMGPVIKELKALGWFLLAGRGRAEMDAQQWEQDAQEKQQRITELEQEFCKAQEQLQQQIAAAKVEVEQREAHAADLQQQVSAAESQMSRRVEELAVLGKQLQGLQQDLAKTTSQLAEREAKVNEMEDVVRQSQGYASTLQNYNTSLQADVQQEKARRDELSREKDKLQGQVAELGGLVKSQERLLELEKEQCAKLREEREGAMRDLAVLRCDLEAARAERERLMAELKDVKEELDKYKDAGGKSKETLEAVKHSKATLEAQLTTQRSLIESMRAELGAAKCYKRNAFCMLASLLRGAIDFTFLATTLPSPMHLHEYADPLEQHALAQSMADSRQTQIKELQAQLKLLQDSLADAERRVYESELIRRKLHNTIQELKGNIRDLLGRGIEITVPGSLTGQAPQKHSFAFDKVFGPNADQASVFDEISELIQSALDGHKVCIFAYGQTGSGKTYTMFGNDDNRGIIPRAMAQVFESSRSLGKQGWKFTMQASMLEIYNEEYKDLLARKKLPDGKQHKVVHDANGGTSVLDLTLVDVNTPEDVEDLLQRSMEKRSVGCTQLNEQSSRSHAVFTLRIEGANDSSKLKVRAGERVKESGATGIRLKEAQAINKSLSALGDVIVALANKDGHIPFRNSKLTWLLQPCLGGDAKTLMFVNISPTTEFAPESLCSLRFAAKVNACEIGVARRNVKTG
eukprot:gene7822-8019_t